MKDMVESEEEMIGACAASKSASSAKRTSVSSQRSSLLSKVSARLSANTKRKSLERGSDSKESSLRIGADRKSDSLRKARKRRSVDRSHQATMVSWIKSNLDLSKSTMYIESKSGLTWGCVRKSPSARMRS